MREIVFRGKCKDTGKWYEGQYIHLTKTTYCFKEDYYRNPDNDIHQIVFEKMVDWGLPNRHLRIDVNPETVGQYTGVKDKNGVKIFEGDILSFVDGDGDTNYLTVIYDRDMFTTKECDFVDRDGLWSDSTLDLEVIGNIYDNPELLKGKETE